MPEFALLAAAAVVLFVAGVVLSQKVKDWLQGVPAHVRTELRAIEVSALGQIKSAQAHVVADLKAKVTVATPVLQTSVVAPVAAPAAPVTVTVIPQPPVAEVASH